MKKGTKRIIRIGKSVAVLIFSVCILMTSSQVGEVYAANSDNLLSSLHHNGYKLEQVVVLSRHNIRSPLSGKGSTLDKSTPYKLHEWTSAPSELSLKGGMLETSMGQYFRRWLEAEQFIPANYHPTSDEVRIYANSKQRTIATAQYFAAGMLPTANMEVEYHEEFDKMDPVFNPQLTFSSDAYKKDATNQIMALYGNSIAQLEDNYDLMEDVIDYHKSERYKTGELTDFVTNDSSTKLEAWQEPGVLGSIRTATQISDAMVLQYYEETDNYKAGFGKKLSTKQWEDICEIKDVCVDAGFAAPLVAINVANPLLEEMYSEMKNTNRKFTFLCGHDSNLTSVLAALNVSEYSLPNAIETKTPIGSKIVFSKWINGSGEEYWAVDMVYQSTEQLRNVTMLDLTTPPCIYHLQFNEIKQNQDGLYLTKDLENLFLRKINDYDVLYSIYAKQAA